MPRRKGNFLILRDRTRTERFEEIVTVTLGAIYSVGFWLLFSIFLWRAFAQ